MHQSKACARTPLSIRNHECSTPYTSDELAAIAHDNIEGRSLPHSLNTYANRSAYLPSDSAQQESAR
ncbi:uncharacterized protein PHACADRAFT_264927 [Phanerochaete carnosa HHB-10118-sp]|uniref:Uncharacterized protein n=1 Tax=Phanerochaete carnosa (strain HHB-10118-sp) TaxID=650164 RepID=K5UL15_PHACS|nr:uncharacterized protein PHACADRAFT_264927 [Phanerochaete carnosa HHB-10118-sp]EKM50311.1 hypothetical protein PHACADRAFT_264927 [Phanerochaete carnosa HHB-10118-sp]